MCWKIKDLKNGCCFENGIISTYPPNEPVPSDPEGRAGRADLPAHVGIHFDVVQLLLIT